MEPDSQLNAAWGPVAYARAAGRAMSTAGSAAQAMVLGTYAWAVTVAPFAWSTSGNVVSRLGAAAAPLALAFGWAAEKKWGTRARLVSFWSFVCSCALSWAAAGPALGSERFGTERGTAGMLAWALFAVAFATPLPPIAMPAGPDVEAMDPRLLGLRKGRTRGDFAYPIAAAAMAVALQAFGWNSGSTERALLTRLVGVACGIALIEAGAALAVGRRTRKSPRARAARLRASMLMLVLLGMLLLSGILVVLRG